MTLNDWQSRFELHFSGLRDERGSNSARPTVYALEHGLTADEASNFVRDVRQSVRSTHRPAQGHRLVWTIYATEVGYGYSGEEYWATFASQTANWEDSNPNREYIRTAFKEFQTRYSGAEPRGRWANHFSIICWPITHAILPQDLQRELAHSLYRIRYDFDSALLADPMQLGRAIAHDAELVAGSRFTQFAEDPLLVGQIAASLLLEESDRSRSHIMPATLIRITDDLTKSRRSLEWLRDARQNASRVRSQPQPRIVSTGQSSHPRNPARQQRTRPALTNIGLKPSLSLRQTAKDRWSLYLRLPDGQALIRTMPELRDTLRNRGCYVAGTHGMRLARGRFLHKGQDVALLEWPDPREPLFRFEGVDEEVNLHLAAANWTLPTKQQWLFKILNDGNADEIATQVVRPDESYILLRPAASQLDLPRSTIPQSLNCDGVIAYRLNVPDVVPTLDQEMIRRAGLSIAEGLWARPIGSLSVYADSESSFAWSLPTRPMIQLGSDFEVSSVQVGLSQSSGEPVSECTVQKLPVILDLGQLDRGNFVLDVRAYRYGSNSVTSEEYTIGILDPDIEERAASIAAPFLMDISPAKPTLEDVWETRTSINIYAPKGTTADLRIELATGERKRPLVYPKRLALPCDEDQWNQYLKSVKRDKQLRNALDAATRCSIEIDCGALGRGDLSLDRQPAPIRWVSREQNSGCLLRLEELDKQAGVSCFSYSFSRPMEPTRFAGDPRTEFREAEIHLYLAETDRQARASVIAAAPLRSFFALRERPYIPALPRSEASISTLLAAHHLWSSARIVGDASAFDRRESVVAGMSKELIRLLCGDPWVQMEQTYHDRPNALALKHSISTKPSHLPAIALIAQGKAIDPERAVENAIDTISQLSVSHDLVEGTHDAHFAHAIVDFAYRLLNQPESLRPENGPGERIIIENLLHNTVLCRMVRFSYLTVNSDGLGTAMVGER
jgi:hypothetical protein